MATQIKQVNTSLGATETTYTDLGDITVPVGASRITGVCAIAAITKGTATEGALGVCKLEFTGGPELDGIPTAMAMVIDIGHADLVPAFLPCNIPVPPNRDIACYIKLTLAQTEDCDGIVSLRFE